MLTVLTVLKSGGEYRREHVFHLRNQIEKFLTIPHRFITMSDMMEGRDVVPLVHNLPGWWSKLEMFAAGALELGPKLYFDLDTIVCGNIDDIALGHRFTMLENFWKADRVGSGIMAWDGGVMAPIFDDFIRKPKMFMEKYSVPEAWGDQAFILAHSRVEPERWQRKFPGRVVSYKFHVRQGVDPRGQQIGTARIPAGASVICFHGQPRPWSTPIWDAA